MKYASQKEITAIVIILIVLLVFGIKPGLELISKFKPYINLYKIAFAGFISFVIVHGIMTLARKYDIWFGKTGGSILYIIVLFIIGFLLF